MLIKAGWSPPLPGDDGRFRAERVLDDIREAEFPVVHLSGREQEVLTLTVDGLSVPEIADELDIAVETVKTYRRALLEKLEARNAPHLVAMAFRRGLVG